jgi:hypothetical protein
MGKRKSLKLSQIRDQDRKQLEEFIVLQETESDETENHTLITRATRILALLDGDTFEKVAKESGCTVATLHHLIDRFLENRDQPMLKRLSTKKEKPNRERLPLRARLVNLLNKYAGESDYATKSWLYWDLEAIQDFLAKGKLNSLESSDASSEAPQPKLPSDIHEKASTRLIWQILQDSGYRRLRPTEGITIDLHRPPDSSELPSDSTAHNKPRAIPFTYAARLDQLRRSLDRQPGGMNLEIPVPSERGVEIEVCAERNKTTIRAHELPFAALRLSVKPGEAMAIHVFTLDGFNPTNKPREKAKWEVDKGQIFSRRLEWNRRGRLIVFFSQSGCEDAMACTIRQRTRLSDSKKAPSIKWVRYDLQGTSDL